MTIGRAQRRNNRRKQVEDYFYRPDVEAALDLLELLDISWHDCYGEVTPPEAVIDDVIELSAGDIAELVHAVRLAVNDPRDLKLNLERLRKYH